MKILILITYAIYCSALPKEFDYKFLGNSYRKMQETELNVTSTQGWDYLRIEYQFFQNYSATDTLFLEQVLNVTKAFYSRYLMVKRNQEPIQFKDTYPQVWFGEIISDEIKAKTYEADVVFFIRVTYEPQSGYLAYSSPIIFDESTKRPKMSFISWNIAYQDVEHMNHGKFEEAVQIALHEMNHGLGFVKEYYSQFYDSFTGQPYPNPALKVVGGQYHLQTPRLVALLQRHFNCSEFHGLPMEDNGGGGTFGSHFERTLLHNDLMTGSILPGDFIITDFTFQFFQDTGFYQMLEYEADFMDWGLNQGCGFVKKQCTNSEYNEFCTNANEYGCTQNMKGIGECLNLDYLANNCQYFMMLEQFDCSDTRYQKDSPSFQYFNYDSMCIKGSISKTQTLTDFSCYQYHCDQNNQLSLIIDDILFPCNDQPIVIPEEYTGNIQCPSNPQSYCQNDNSCPNKCNSKGYCMKGKCICTEGFAGKACEIACTNLRYQSQCVEACPLSTFQVGINCLGCPGGCQECTNYKQCTKCQENYLLTGDFCVLMPLISIEELIEIESKTQKQIEEEKIEKQRIKDLEQKKLKEQEELEQQRKQQQEQEQQQKLDEEKKQKFIEEQEINRKKAEEEENERIKQKEENDKLQYEQQKEKEKEKQLEQQQLSQELEEQQKEKQQEELAQQQKENQEQMTQMQTTINNNQKLLLYAFIMIFYFI